MLRDWAPNIHHCTSQKPIKPLLNCRQYLSAFLQATIRAGFYKSLHFTEEEVKLDKMAHWRKLPGPVTTRHMPCLSQLLSIRILGGVRDRTVGASKPL